MTTEQTATLIVDGLDLRRAPHLVMGRGPRLHERIDYGRLLFFARWEAFGGRERRRVRPIFVQHETPGAEAFFAYLRHLGYELRLHPDRSRGRWAQADALVEELHATDGDLVYAGGFDYKGGITAMLHEMATAEDRQVVVAHYDGLRSIDCGHVRYRGLAADIGAMPLPVPVQYASDFADEDEDDGGWTVRRYPSGFTGPGPNEIASWN